MFFLISQVCVSGVQWSRLILLKFIMNNTTEDQSVKIFGKIYYDLDFHYVEPQTVKSWMVQSCLPD